MPREPLHRRLFRVLLRLFPAEFRGDFGEQMAADFEDQRREAGAQPRAVRRLWIRTTVDLLARAPREHLDVLWRDVVCALRSVRRHPTSTAVAVLSLAIGIGLNAAVFSVVYGVLWRDLPFPDSDRLVQIGRVSPGQSQPGLLTHADLHEVSRRAPALESVGAALWERSIRIVRPGEPRDMTCPAMTPNLLDIIGVAPVVGRTFTSTEYAQALGDRRGLGPYERPAPRVMMLSHTLWQRMFGGDGDVVGERLTLNGGDKVEIVGVMGPEMESAAGTVAGMAECWTPGELPPAVIAGGNTTYWNFFVVGKLRQGASIREVQEDLNLIDADSEQGLASDGAPALRALPLHDVVVGEVHAQLTLLFGAVVCVLLVTCANVANLLLARASGRRDELATRAALGATCARLVGQSLTESLVLSAVGGLGGLALALWTVPAIVSWAPADVPRLVGVGVDWRTFAFAAVVTAVVGVCCGLLPALIARHGSVPQPSTGRATPRVGRFRQGLAVAEIALALVLVVGATLMVRTVRTLGLVELGFEPDRVISTSLPGTTQDRAVAIGRVRALPGVLAAGVGDSPIARGGMFGDLTVPGDPRQFGLLRVQPVTPGYFEALGVRLMAGRTFEEEDLVGEGALPIVINQTAARMFFADGDPIGRTLVNGRSIPRVVVGVIADLRSSLEAEPGPTVYQVATRSTEFGTSGVLIKLDREPDAVVPAIRSIARSIDLEAPFYGATLLQTYVDRETAPRRFILQVIGLFSLLGLGLAVIGVYGVLAEFVTQRVPEIGVRVAFGATTGTVVRLVLRQGWRLAAIGVPLGLAGAAALNSTMRAQVYGVSTLDPTTYATAAGCLLLATVAACLVPARRAARLDPVAALRAE